ncbi:D-alanyl-D-alanine carboxypeptidase DdcY [Enterococcus faecium]|uniref:D-alanyl-D-alanine carboxypeptidase DdcY n=1 Tax=Enterococcus faecium TaxID=1352 RepID=UPI0008DD93BB|nr:D-alanyl-D-alanine carboxypeptidase DdcY [Enterococcus faecium]MDY5177788.1 D-alanyl-D-alanine carboxypeptidase DdcY [Lactococcus lactis]MDT2357290.1 D-alanyl-D-alanine carboxypeptidase DdcY [Enterococcus faecium]OHY83104.1 D-Ala-D-Ala carboxypeptidase VanY [Enterococcus faecium]OHY87228.1 D-Ala-D-Ala carboxypeptidase VanY [Enterococcus faecium]PHL10779.1 D-Ala-D-Ala carboxypeptidase VanY [Enterococcus faecium]
MKRSYKTVAVILLIVLLASIGLFFRKIPQKIQVCGEERDSWNLLLVNAKHKIPQGYTVELQKLSNDQAVDKRIYPDLQLMLDAARAEGIYPKIVSSFRTTEDQEKIMEDKIAAFQEKGYSNQKAKEEAAKWVAAPGTCEHELGLAVDINAESSISTDKEVYEWLADNAYQYGFILRYPSNKVHITGVGYEPWHYRYVGKKAAKKITEAGITLEEYLGKTE